ncbi:MFS transporter [Dioszegia hungarica]|uniref:MFS transporter n=1 Tax=Dioszegia hungarica TaxID=4972 RepID=A0AA38HI48_9TREE|nr:MFS transporter [Dioszegia hungarica]KAI9639879.1 MFS transporter [Dioszegia hungarica]
MSAQEKAESLHKADGGLDGHPVAVPPTEYEIDETSDVAGKFLARIAQREDAAELLAPHSEREEKVLLRKVDWIMMTLLQFALMMGSVDKVSIGSAAVLGLRTDLNLQGQEYSLTSAAIYFGAICSIIPSLALMQRVPANLYISTMVMCWGIITCMMPLCTNYSTFFGVRFLLGIFESVIFAGFGLIVSMWWTRKEQPFRTAIIFSTLSSVMNGLLATAAQSYKGTALKQWQLLFMIVGLITFVWSIMLFCFLPASPTSAWWLTLRQRVIATRRQAGNHTGMESKQWKWAQFFEALYDPKTWLIFCINLVLNIPNGGLVTFNSIIVASLGFTIQQTTLLGIPTGVISWISSLFFGWLAVKTGQRCYAAMAACVIPLVGTILLYTVPRSNIGGSLVSLYLVYFYWGPYIVMMGSVYANTGGYTKKMIVYALSYIGYSVGNIVGPLTFTTDQAPKYTGGVIAMLVCYCAAIFLILAYRFLIQYSNRQRERTRQGLGDLDSNDLLAEWQDQTDFKNPRFVYEL